MAIVPRPVEPKADRECAEIFAAPQDDACEPRSATSPEANDDGSANPGRQF
jgi:hypothetical protein